jgi:hypothetical protein
MEATKYNPKKDISNVIGMLTVTNPGDKLVLDQVPEGSPRNPRTGKPTRQVVEEVTIPIVSAMLVDDYNYQWCCDSGLTDELIAEFITPYELSHSRHIHRKPDPTDKVWEDEWKNGFIAAWNRMTERIEQIKAGVKLPRTPLPQYATPSTLRSVTQKLSEPNRPSRRTTLPN